MRGWAPVGGMTAGDAPRHCAEKTVVSRIVARDTTRYGALDTAFGLSRNGRQGKTETNCRERE
jgi:hypothetical protein